MSKLINGDCIEAMQKLPANSVDAVVCDPPYAIGFMGKEFDTFKSNKHYMKFSYKWAKEALRVLKPGGYLVAFSGTRTYHYAAVGIEEAGFTCRDMISWLYGSGMPKSYNISKALDKAAGAKRKVIGKSNRHVSGKPEQKTEGLLGTSTFKETIGMGQYLTAPATDEAKHWDGYGTNLKPCQEPIAVFQKPISEKTIAANCLKWGTGAIDTNKPIPQIANNKRDVDSKKTMFDGQSMLKSKTKAVIGGSDVGRWPGNIIHDGSPEVLACFPVTKSGAMKHKVEGYRSDKVVGFIEGNSGPHNQHGDSGSAGRFFYCVKVSKKERELGLENFHQTQSSFWQTGNGASGKPSSIEKNRKARAPRANDHPTVKPVDLMRYLVSIYCPHDGVVLDPFMGSGTTGIACFKAGKQFIGIEKDAGYFKIATHRINHFEAKHDFPLSLQGRTKFTFHYDTKKAGAY